MAISSRADRASLLYLACGALLSAIYLLPTSASVKAAVTILLTVSAVAAIAVGFRLHAPSERRPWVLLGVVQLLWAVGWIFWQGEILLVGAPPAPASPVNLLFLASYPALIGALKILGERRDPNLAVTIDVGVIACGIAGVAWVALGAAYVDDEAIPPFGRAIQITYALFDVILLAFVARLALTRGKRTPAFQFLLASAAALVCSDLIWNWSTKLATYSPGSWADVGWLLFAFFAGAAALHPSMKGLFEQQQAEQRKLRVGLLAVLAAASLVGPFLFLVTGTRPHSTGELIPAGIAVILASVLVFARMALVIREGERLGNSLEERNQQLRAVEDELRAALGATESQLESVVASVPGAIYRCAIDDHWTFLTVTDGIEEITGWKAGGAHARRYANVGGRHAPRGPRPRARDDLRPRRPRRLVHGRLSHRPSRWIDEVDPGTGTRDS